ncbi:MAG: branched-chain amino acid ABC transporter permease, partial [Candidatus Thorarchaeota archaeon]
MGMYMGWWILQVLSYVFDKILPFDSLYLINNIFTHAAFAFVAVGLTGIAFEILVYSRLRNIKASLTAITVGSIGVGFIIRYLLGMIWGNLPQAGANYTNSPELPHILPDFLRQAVYRFTIVRNNSIFGTQGVSFFVWDLLMILFAIITVIGVDYMFRKTKFGIAMRATSDSFELAQVSGINTKRIIYWTWFLAGGITALGATFLRPTQGSLRNLDGLFWLLPVFAVAILGGVGSFRGGVVAAILIAFSRQIASVVLSILHSGYGSGVPFEVTFQNFMQNLIGLPGITFAPAYADGIGFFILILVLLFRPQGLFGSVEATRERV